MEAPLHEDLGGSEWGRWVAGWELQGGKQGWDRGSTKAGGSEPHPGWGRGAGGRRTSEDRSQGREDLRQG